MAPAPPARTLFVNGFSHEVQAIDLAKPFEAFGDIVRCDITKGKSYGNPIAFIEFVNQYDSERAWSELDNSQFEGRRLHVDYAVAAPKSNWDPISFHRNGYDSNNSNGRERTRGRSRSRSLSPSRNRGSSRRAHSRSRSRSRSRSPASRRDRGSDRIKTPIYHSNHRERDYNSSRRGRSRSRSPSRSPDARGNARRSDAYYDRDRGFSAGNGRYDRERNYRRENHEGGGRNYDNHNNHNNNSRRYEEDRTLRDYSRSTQQPEAETKQQPEGSKSVEKEYSEMSRDGTERSSIERSSTVEVKPVENAW